MPVPRAASKITDSRQALGFGDDKDAAKTIEDLVMEELKKTFKPEFLNRVDEIITFNHLTKENFLGIANIMLEELRDSLRNRGLDFTWTDEVRQHLVDDAYSVVYGARNLRRIIQKELEDPISEAVIDSFEKPISGISARMEDGVIKLDVQEA